MICENITVAENGHLKFAGQDVTELAAQYGTPLYLMDEDLIRANCRTYQQAFRKHFGDKARPLYASKANSFKRIYEIMHEEKANQKERVRFEVSQLRNYFPKGYTARQMEQAILQLLEANYKK